MHLPCTLAFMGSGCSSLFLPNMISISHATNVLWVLCLAAAAALALLSCLGLDQRLPLTYKDKVKLQRELVARGL